jgi:hypothetical protein
VGYVLHLASSVRILLSSGANTKIANFQHSGERFDDGRHALFRLAKHRFLPKASSKKCAFREFWPGRISEKMHFIKTFTPGHPRLPGFHCLYILIAILEKVHRITPEI